MKLIAFLFLFAFGTLQACEWTAELRAGYFYPSSNLFRKIYRQGGVEGELELTKNLSNWNSSLQAWANVNYFTKRGRSRGLHDKTYVDIIPLSFGLRYVFQPNCRLRPYFGIGPSYTFVHIKNHTHFAKGHSNKDGFGFALKSGIYYDLTCRFVLDLFADYYYHRVHFHSTGTHNLGGLRTGAGIGYKF